MTHGSWHYPSMTSSILKFVHHVLYRPNGIKDEIYQKVCCLLFFHFSFGRLPFTHVWPCYSWRWANMQYDNDCIFVLLLLLFHCCWASLTRFIFYEKKKKKCSHSLYNPFSYLTILAYDWSHSKWSAFELLLSFSLAMRLFFARSSQLYILQCPDVRSKLIFLLLLL